MSSSSEPNTAGVPQSDPAHPPSMIGRFLLGGIALYQRAARPLMPPTCRFFPSCSDYAVEAITTHGVARGTLLAVARICRCHPFHPGGVDLVPPRIQLPSSSPESPP